MSTPLAAPCRIVIMAKAPVAGLSKTRLIPALGPDGAARLAARMLLHTVKTAFEAKVGPVEICATPSADHPAWRSMELPNVQWSEQGEGDLGARMAVAVRRTLARGEHPLLMGIDCPALSAATLQSAAQALTTHDATLIPTADGGYALLGLARWNAGIFEDMPWSTPTVAQHTLQRFANDGWRVQLGAVLHDIDEPADLAHLPPSLKLELRGAADAS